MIRQKGSILLGMKKRGFGQGRWNGFGGKVLPGETIEQAALRELQEEVGIKPVEMISRGVITYSFNAEPEKLLPVHMFEITEFTGEPYESEEMRPQWFKEKDIPYDHMWSSDSIWLPEFLKGGVLEGRFHFKDVDDDEVLWHELRILPKSS
jgi:mutator protein MutT